MELAHSTLDCEKNAELLLEKLLCCASFPPVVNNIKINEILLCFVFYPELITYLLYKVRVKLQLRISFISSGPTVVNVLIKTIIRAVRAQKVLL